MLALQPPPGTTLGIDDEQALELFHQTVSMKSVGNLTDFVCSHMLEPFDVAPRFVESTGSRWKQVAQSVDDLAHMQPNLG